MPTLSVEEQATQTYHDNISYLKAHQPRLFKQLSDFEVALEKGFYEERYTLEYIDGGYFDVKELSSGRYLYGKDSKTYAKKCANGIDYAKKGSLFETFYNFKFTSHDIERYKDLGIQSNGVSGIAPIVHYTENIVNKDMHLKRIEKFVFFGVGLGTHLTAVDKKVEAKVYLIVEDDLELFRLSLFVTNYQNLARHSTLFFAIFEEDDIVKVIFTEFLEKNFFDNHYIKYFQMLNADDSKFNIFHSVVASLDYMVYPYHAYFTQYLRPLSYMKARYKFLDVSGRNPIKAFEKHPVLVVAAGPSLQKNIAWLKQYHERFIVVAVTAALSTLQKASISPDVVVHLDPFEEGSLSHIDKLKSLKFLKNSLFLFSAKTPHALTERFEKERVFIYEESTHYIENFGVAKSSCVGSTSHALSLILGAKESYLLGLDMALDEESGSTHSPDHSFNQKLNMTDIEQVKDIFAYKNSVIKVKGNFQDEVHTTASLYNSILGMIYNEDIYKKQYQKVYNLNGGAYLRGAEPLQIESLKIDDFNPIDKESLHDSLLKTFDKNATCDFDGVVKLVQKRLMHTKQIKEHLKNYQRNISYTSVDSYRRQLGILVNDLLDVRMQESLNLVVIYYKYLQYVLPYVYDMLNTKELSNPKRHMKKIDKLLFAKLSQIVEYYEDAMEAFVEEALVL